MASILHRPMISAIRDATQQKEAEQRVATQQQNLERQQSDLAGRTAGSLRARRGRSAMLLGGEDQQSTLG